MPFSKSAAIAAAMFAILGITGVSTPGRAYDLNRPAVTTPQLSTGQVPAQTDAQAETKADAAVADEQESYDSLSEAIADQDIPAQIDGDLRCLAEAVYFESKGEPLSGQLAVAQVILNRTQSGRFPATVCSVVKQSGQFSFVRGGSLPETPFEKPSFRTAVAVSLVAMNGDWDSDAGDALYFHARRVAPSWRMRRVASIGNHVFYR